jgi:hypothetical protein
LIIYAAEGRSFDTGTGLSPELSTVVPELAEVVLAEGVRLVRRT